MFLPKTSAGQDLLLRHKRVVFDVTVTGNATPASVLHGSDVPGAVFLATESLDDAAAQDSGCNFGTLVNNSTGASTMGLLVQCPDALGGICDKLYTATVTCPAANSGAITVALKGASSTGITASGNVAFTIAGASADLSTENITYRVTLECQIQAF